MAIATGRQTTEREIRRYIGVAPVYVLAVNPTKEELESIYGNQLEKSPEYLGTVKVGEDQHEVKNVRLDFIVKTDPEKTNGIEMISKVSLFIRQEPRLNSDQTKIQVIDKYGRTAWVTREELKEHLIPTYSNGPANLDKDYRPCYAGEDVVTDFLKIYLNIPNIMSYNSTTKTWSETGNPNDCLIRLDKVADYFSGNFSEIQEAIKLQPLNKIKVLFGVRTTEENNQYQDAYTRMFLRNGVTDYSRLSSDVETAKNNGAYKNTEFEICDLKEYVNTPTNLNTPTAVEDPFTNPNNSSSTVSADDPWSFEG